MGIYSTVNELKILAINTETVNQASFGDIQLYNNKATIKYPYVNFDIVNSRVRNNSNIFTFRIYVLDRNEPYIAYNKTKLILDSILKHHTIDATNYDVKYLTLTYKDLVNGCWCDFELETGIDFCLTSLTGFTITNETGLYELTNSLVSLASAVDTVNSANFGNLELYDNKATIDYPYVNFDIVNSKVVNNSCEMVFQVYVFDRNEPYIAYNKTELILNNILKYHNLEIKNYTINYFTLDYKDMVNGCWAEFSITTNTNYNCLISNNDTEYIITEQNDYIIEEIDEKYIVTE